MRIGNLSVLYLYVLESAVEPTIKIKINYNFISVHLHMTFKVIIILYIYNKYYLSFQLFLTTIQNIKHVLLIWWIFK